LLLEQPASHQLDDAAGRRGNRGAGTASRLFVRPISHQLAVLFSQNKPATSNQPAVLFSQNKSASAISHHQGCRLAVADVHSALEKSNLLYPRPNINRSRSSESRRLMEPIFLYIFNML
jgi:hypothetical protein